MREINGYKAVFQMASEYIGSVRLDKDNGARLDPAIERAAIVRCIGYTLGGTYHAGRDIVASQRWTNALHQVRTVLDRASEGDYGTPESLAEGAAYSLLALDLDPLPADRPVMAGDAVRLAAPWPGASEAKVGAIGVIGGMIGPVDGGSVTFSASTHRNDRVVSCSGGPASIHTDASELVRTDETTTLTAWRFRDDRRQAGNAIHYTVTVPVWNWYPKG